MMQTLLTQAAPAQVTPAELRAPLFGAGGDGECLLQGEVRADFAKLMIEERQADAVSVTGGVQPDSDEQERDVKSLTTPVAGRREGDDKPDSQEEAKGDDANDFLQRLQASLRQDVSLVTPLLPPSLPTFPPVIDGGQALPAAIAVVGGNEAGALEHGAGDEVDVARLPMALPGIQPAMDGKPLSPATEACAVGLIENSVNGSVDVGRSPSILPPPLPTAQPEIDGRRALSAVAAESGADAVEHGSVASAGATPPEASLTPAAGRPQIAAADPVVRASNEVEGDEPLPDNPLRQSPLAKEPRAPLAKMWPTEADLVTEEASGAAASATPHGQPLGKTLPHQNATPQTHQTHQVVQELAAGALDEEAGGVNPRAQSVAASVEGAGTGSASPVAASPSGAEPVTTPVPGETNRLAAAEPATTGKFTPDVKLKVSESGKRGVPSTEPAEHEQSQSQPIAQHSQPPVAMADNKPLAEPSARRDGHSLPHLRLADPEAPAELRQKVNLMLADKLQQVELQLDPLGLGKMKIQIQVDASSQASVHFVVQHGQTREMLEQSMPRLRDMLAGQGIQLGQTQVQQQSQQQAQQQQGQSAFAGQGQQGQQAQQGSGPLAAGGQTQGGDKASTPGAWLDLEKGPGIDFYA